jgi:uncharacterized protein (DUF849 family)
MVAPTGARKTKADHPALPIALPEIVETAVACHAAGADGIHLHVRDANGRHTLDAQRYREAIAALSSTVPDLAIQITTEAVGMYSAADQRALIEDVRPRLVSVSLAEMTSDGDLDAAANFYRECRVEDIAVQHILYGEDDLKQMTRLLDGGHLDPDDLQMIFVLGRYTHGQTSVPDDLHPFTDWLKLKMLTADWAVCAFGPHETQCLVQAHHLGGKLRVGFENSFWNSDGSLAKDNAERVAKVANAIS